MYKIIRHGTDIKLKQNTKEGIEYLTFPKIEECGIVSHLFSTRIGGVSKGCYSEINFSYTRGDEKEDVDENFKRIQKIMGYERGLERFVCTYQTHTTNVRLVTKDDMGKGTIVQRDYTDIDGLICNDPGVILTIYYADCTPLMFVDPVNKAIGLSHSGWRGTVNRMGAKTLKAMNDNFGTKAEDVICGIGPSICGDCYEVGNDVKAEFISSFGEKKVFDEKIMTPEEGKPGKYLLDIWNANRFVLEEAGVKRDNIEMTDICTFENSDYLFSHRKTGEKRGNLAAFLALR